MLAIVQK